MNQQDIQKMLGEAFLKGQRYWELAASESFADNKRSYTHFDKWSAWRDAKVAELAALLETKPQPIATAPKKGDILLYFPTSTGIWAQGSKRHGRLGEPEQDEFMWRCNCCGRFGNPTHWLPLPPKPEGS